MELTSIENLPEPIVEGKISPTTTKICAKDHNDDRSKNIE